tara:strand:- start:246 stop:926 length:681 start_codon:yes stop_codon:yes gene_type:complete
MKAKIRKFDFHIEEESSQTQSRQLNTTQQLNSTYTMASHLGALKQAQEMLHLLGVPRLAAQSPALRPPLPFDLVSRIIKEADGGRYAAKQQMDKVVTDINKVWDFIRAPRRRGYECRVCELEEFGYNAPPEFGALWKAKADDPDFDIAPWGGNIQNATAEACSNDTQPGPMYMRPDPNGPGSVDCDLRRNFVDYLEEAEEQEHIDEECLQYQFRNTELGKVRSIHQ